jgi:hypothetical protein
MQPAEGYQVATVTVDGVSLPPTSTAGSFTKTTGWYTFMNVVTAHTIDVQFKLCPAGWFTCTPYAGSHGCIWMAQQTVQATSTIPGAIIACSIIPDSGYHVETLVVDGAPVTPATWYIFYNVRAGHTIAATFALDPLLFNIVASAGAHGSISHAGSVAFTQGTDAAYAFTPDSGYQVASVTVDGGAVALAPSYTFSNVQETHTISVTFEAIPVVPVATSLTINVSPTTLKLGRSAHLFGVIAPNMSDRTPVRLMVRKAGQTKWTNVAPYVRTSGGYHWSFYYHPNTRGTYYFKVQYSATATYLGSASRTVTVVWK